MLTVKVIRIDPYHPHLGLLVPFLAQRIMEGAQQYGEEVVGVVPQFFSRLWAKDPTVLLLAAVDPTGRVKGYTAATTDPGGITLMQPRLDEPCEGDPIKEMMDLIEEWGRGFKAPRIQLVSRRADPKWMKKHGFEIDRYVMVREIVFENQQNSVDS